jgi:hypothetical protein
LSYQTHFDDIIATIIDRNSVAGDDEMDENCSHDVIITTTIGWG